MILLLLKNKKKFFNLPTSFMYEMISYFYYMLAFTDDLYLYYVCLYLRAFPFHNFHISNFGLFIFTFIIICKPSLVELYYFSFATQ